MNPEKGVEPKVTTASLPTGLKQRFEKLPTRNEYMNFSDFVRRKVEIAITQEERLQTWVVEDTEARPPHTPRESVDKDKSR